MTPTRRPHGWHDGTQPLTEPEWFALLAAVDRGELEDPEND